VAPRPRAPRFAGTVREHLAVQRVGDGVRAADRGADARPAGHRAVAVRNRVRRALCRRAGGLSVSPAARCAARHRHRAAMGGHAARLLASCAGVHSARRRRGGVRSGRATRPGDDVRGVQSGVRDLPTAANANGSARPDAGGVDDHRQVEHRRADRAVGSPRCSRRGARGNRRRGTDRAGHAAAVAQAAAPHVVRPIFDTRFW